MLGETTRKRGSMGTGDAEGGEKMPLVDVADC